MSRIHGKRGDASVGTARASKSVRRSAKSSKPEKPKGHKPKKQLISADGTPYSPWQRRTRVLCILLLVYGGIEVASGIVFVCLGYGLGFWLGDVAGGLSIRVQTLVFGCYNLLIALLGLRGAKNPKKVTLFFWAVLVNVVLMAWQVASEISLHVFELSSMITFVVMFAFAACAWKLREQTGYFDNHPKPEDELELAEPVEPVEPVEALEASDASEVPGASEGAGSEDGASAAAHRAADN